MHRGDKFVRRINSEDRVVSHGFVALRSMFIMVESYGVDTRHDGRRKIDSLTFSFGSMKLLTRNSATRFNRCASDRALFWGGSVVNFSIEPSTQDTTEVFRHA